MISSRVLDWVGEAKGAGVAAGEVQQMLFGGVEVLVETVPVYGSEPTGAGDMAGQVVDVFDRARVVIAGAAASTAAMIAGLGGKIRPERVEVEFGLGFSVKGNVIVAGASSDVAMKVKLIYNTELAVDNSSAEGVATESVPQS